MAAIPETLAAPVLTQYKEHLASLLAAASGLTQDQTFLLIEERFDDEFDLSVAMQKTKRFKIDGDLNVIAQEWLAKVRLRFNTQFWPCSASRTLLSIILHLIRA
jgi:hypothetical protein